MDVFEQFQRSQLISVLPLEEQRRLFAIATQRSLKRGDAIWAEGQECEEIVIGRRGWFKLVRSTGAGREAITELREPGSLLCASAPCAGSKYCCTSIALEDEAEVTAVPMDAFYQAIERNPGAALKLVRHIADRRVEACHRLTQLSNGAVPQRLAALLCALAVRAGIVTAHGHTRVPIPLTRTDLSQLCATTAESVIRQMSDMERRHVVQTATRGFLILDLPKLKQMAAGEYERGTQGLRAAAT